MRGLEINRMGRGYNRIYTYGQESPGWISLVKLALFFYLFLKIYRNVNFFGKIDLSMNSGPQWAGDNKEYQKKYIYNFKT